jgi:hypothetical protein
VFLISAREFYVIFSPFSHIKYPFLHQTQAQQGSHATGPSRNSEKIFKKGGKSLLFKAILIHWALPKEEFEKSCS